MANFIKVDTMDNMKFSSRWKNSTTFHSHGRYINKQGEYVKASYPGPKYQLVLKKERAYTACERIVRITQGILYSILTLGLCNFKKDYRAYFVADKKVCRFALLVPNGRLTGSQDDIKEEEKEKPLDQTRGFR